MDTIRSYDTTGGHKHSLLQLRAKIHAQFPAKDVSFLLGPCDSGQSSNLLTKGQNLQSGALKQRQRKGYRALRESGNTVSATDLPEAWVFVWTVASALLCSGSALQRALLLLTDKHSWPTVKKGKRQRKRSPGRRGSGASDVCRNKCVWCVNHSLLCGVLIDGG